MVAGRQVYPLTHRPLAYHVHGKPTVIDAVFALINKDPRLGWSGVLQVRQPAVQFVIGRILRLLPISSVKPHPPIHRNAPYPRIDDPLDVHCATVARTAVQAGILAVWPQRPELGEPWA